MAPPSKQAHGTQTPWAAAGAMAVVALCCGGHAVLLGALGGVALGGVLGVGAGVLAAVVLAAALVGLRRRRAGSCATDPERRPR